ncbi:MAG: aminotransferase class III-fold pyridoxal phosphate-dependent enzyme [Chloroflexi bacterium]|nr:MAG: aminotransferase class III-fold pyridoxal phosphate-dependent enzyme [Chloroflexota bacterium]
MTTIATANHALYERAMRLMPGGVSSPVRAFGAVGGEPPFIVAGEGSRVRDSDGNSYVDLVCSWGPLIAGHAHPAVVAAIAEQAARGTSFGMPTPGEVELAEAITTAMPSIQMVRFVSSGTEHGHVDALLARAGSGLATFGLPDSAGVPPEVARSTITVPFNDLAAAERVARENALAAIVVEPYAGNMGCVPPANGFLEGLRRVASETGTLLVFDEVITGFRLARGGAQEILRIAPDITCLGKVIGGGVPIGAYGASQALMHRVAPMGPVYQAGTLSGNPLATAAGLATLALLDGAAFERLERLGALLEHGLDEAIARGGVPARVQRAGSLLTLFFIDRPVRNEDDAKASDRVRFAAFHRAMLRRGVLLPPSQFECWFLSLAHDDDAIDTIVAATAEALEEVA